MQRVWRGLSDIMVSDRSLVWNSDLMEALELQNLMGNAMTTMVGKYGGAAREFAEPMRTMIIPTVMMRTG